VDARDYIVTFVGIKRARIVKARADGVIVTEKVKQSASAVIVSLPARVLAMPVLSISSTPDLGTISSSSVNVRFESSIAIGRPRLRKKGKNVKLYILYLYPNLHYSNLNCFIS
jgi:hypothetical protein